MFHVIYLDPGNEGERAAFDQHEPWATTRRGIIQHRRFNTGSDGGDLCWYRPFSRVVFVCCFPHTRQQKEIYGQAMHRPGALRIRGRRAPVLEMRSSVDTHHPVYGIHGARHAFSFFRFPFCGAC